MRAGRAGHYDGWFRSTEPGYRNLGTQVPEDVDEALTEWCERAGEPKRDVLAAMVSHFVESEAEFEQLLAELHDVPRRSPSLSRSDEGSDA